MTGSECKIDRRRLLAVGSSLAAVGTIAAQPRPARRRIIIDGLGGFSPDGLLPPSGFEVADGRLRATAALLALISSGQLTGVSQTVGPVGEGEDRFRRTLEAIRVTDQLIADNPQLLIKALSAADLGRCAAERKLGIIYNIQDTTAVGHDLSRIERLHALGLRILQLTYNKPNLAGSGALSARDDGLTPFGRDVIATVEAHRMVMDFSHGGPKTIEEGVKASTRPSMISHTGCRALNDHPRNVSDKLLKLVADRGGTTGIYFMPFLRARGQPNGDDLVRHLTHAVRVAGEDHVSIGTDNSIMGIEDLAAAREAQRNFYADRKARGIAAPGEAADVLNAVSGYYGGDRLSRLAGELQRQGWPGRRVDKILGHNFLRVFGDAVGA